MQYPVPQFTDVEDKIIGPLTFRQFMILAVVGTIIVVAYSATKSTVLLVITVILFGLPAIALAFGKMNGRPLYNAILPMLQYALNPKELLFHKEGYNIANNARIQSLELAPVLTPAVAADSAQTSLDRLKKLEFSLAEEVKQEAELSAQTSPKQK